MASKPSPLTGLKRGIDNISSDVMAYLAVVYALALDHTFGTPDPSRHGAVYRAQQVGTVIQVGVIGLAIIIIILVYAEVDGALPTPSNTDLANAQSNATSTFGSAMELAPVIMIILLAGVVIAVVQRFRA